MMDVIKAAALATMACDHAGFLFHVPVLREIGRIAFPLFAFTTAYGWERTSDRDRYLYRLMLGALWSQGPFLWMYVLAGEYRPPDLAWTNLLFAIGLLLVLIGRAMPGGIRRGRRLGGMPRGDFAVLCLFLAVRILSPQGNALYTMAGACLGLRLLESAELCAAGRIVSASGAWIALGTTCDYSVFGAGLIVSLYLSRRDGPLRRLGDGTARYGRVAVLSAWNAAMASSFYEGMPSFLHMSMGTLLIHKYLEWPVQEPAGPAMRRLCWLFYPLHLAGLCAIKLIFRW